MKIYSANVNNNMFNKNWCPLAGRRNKDNFVWMRFHAKKSSANRSWEASRQDKTSLGTDSKSVWSAEYVKSYTSIKANNFGARQPIVKWNHLPV